MEQRKDGKKEKQIEERKELTWNLKLPVVANSQLRRAVHQGLFTFPVCQNNYKVPCICIFMLSII